jgi:2-polyprenyl-3-methyl-5-hydroxy-6-metoxy-1,4-benzoquinol methylase
MPVSEKDVRDAYRFILGRMPENDNVVRQHQDNASDFDDLRNAFIRSTEFANARERPFLGFELPQEIDVELDEKSLAAVVARLGCYWKKVGAEAPHWSVLTHSRFMATNVSRNQRDFYETGFRELDLVVSLLKRVRRSPRDFKRMIEFGCGVGRCTIPSGKAFANVTAVDISPTHIELAKEYATAEGLTNIEFLQATPENIMPALNYDLWFSRFVLQHNPPPVTLAILSRAFKYLNSDGIAIIQVPTFFRGYRFKISEYLSNSRPLEMEMHVTPASHIFEAAFQNDCCLVDVHEEPGHVESITNIFTFKKVARPRCS